ncbi:formimidoylglutamase [Flavobacterium salilacus subsp. salilacus]|uniref:formimidoylglutamase n=1 Tax=Flavobacterium TaxID=237 RepID=UPI001075295E|nr:MULTISPECIES: formimidoylglutamase [Flavobacterium]KAF2519872.1 formimidoylglutamase [Flavobacterium salilacus subsp. salilacus]MBE1614223.1 formimidoylglutamase [Flavobacterium sp. SaA2.13]
MAFEFLKPLESTFTSYAEALPSQSLGKKMLLHFEGNFPDTEGVSIAIIGVLDNRGAESGNKPIHLNYIRKQLYGLYPGNWDKTIADLGNIPAGNTVKDTYYVVKTIVEELVKNKIIPVIIGGSQDITYAMYRGYDRLEQMVNLVAIDSKFDFGKEKETITAKSYLTHIIVDEPNNLFNYSNVGYQTYFNPQEEIDLIEKLYFDAYRLGEIAGNPTIAEPVFRDADIVSLDMESVKSGDSGNIVNFLPNGFNGKEICTLARYAGISDKVTCFGIFNHQDTKQEGLLIAQIVWYFIEGVHYRSNEYPFDTKENYIKYIVPMDEEELIFYKSDKTDRWWIEVPFITNVNNKLKRNTLLPCTHDDYLGACDGGFPERLWKAQRKNII